MAVSFVFYVLVVTFGVERRSGMEEMGGEEVEGKLPSGSPTPPSMPCRTRRAAQVIIYLDSRTLAELNGCGVGDVGFLRRGIKLTTRSQFDQMPLSSFCSFSVARAEMRSSCRSTLATLLANRSKPLAG